MAKKKTTKRKPTAKRPAAKKATAKKKSSSRSATKKAATKTAAKKKVAKPKKAAAKKTSAPKRKSSKAKTLGRPRVPGDADVDKVFKNDFEARKICEFLNVKTLKQLEKYDPDEIVAKLKAPIVQTVGRMRIALAIANRSLSGDERFAIDFRERHAIGES